MRTVLSLFSGIGLGDLGCEVAGCETVGQVEIDSWNRTVLEHHWPGLWRRGDITEVTDAEFARFAGVWCVAGGFPCQDISVAGKGAGIDGERSGLWTHMRRAISVCRPTWALIENVPALRTRGANRVLADMAELGYACTPLVVGAWAVGAPHRRDRVWIICRDVGDSHGIGFRAIGEVHQKHDLARGICGTGLADSSREQRQQRTNGNGTGTGGDEMLADTRSERCGSGPRKQGNKAGEGIGRGESGGSGGMEIWPTGPGQPQHEWEAPRLLAHSNRRTRNGERNQRDSSDQRSDGNAGAEEELPRQSESGLGGAADDRTGRRAMARWRKASLKGLGNAQVPLVVAAVVRAMIRTEDS